MDPSKSTTHLVLADITSSLTELIKNIGLYFYIKYT